MNASLHEKLNYDFIRDTTPVAGLVRTPLVLEVHPSVPAKTVPELIAHAKANPRKLNMASGGNGSSGHVSGELFKMLAGIEMVHVPYRGVGVALTDGGQVQVMLDPIPSSIEHIRAGKLRPLAVTTSARSEGLPDIPTIAEYVAGFEASSWYGVRAPRNTPAEIVDRLNTVVNAALANPKFKASLADLGSAPMPTTYVDFRKFVAAESEKWGKVIKFANVKPE